MTRADPLLGTCRAVVNVSYMYIGVHNVHFVHDVVVVCMLTSLE